MSSETDWYETQAVAEAMIKYGESFVHHLGQALLRADLENSKKIKKTFCDYWNKYYDMAQAMEESDLNENV